MEITNEKIPLTIFISDLFSSCTSLEQQNPKTIIYENNVYVAGLSYKVTSKACYWKNGEQVILDGKVQDDSPLSIYITD